LRKKCIFLGEGLGVGPGLGQDPELIGHGSDISERTIDILILAAEKSATDGQMTEVGLS
jgi:hypothetical protein